MPAISTPTFADITAVKERADMFHRTLGLRKSAEETYQWYLAHESTDENVAFALWATRGLTAGVNAFINSMTSATTPIEFKILGFTPQPWEVINSFVWAKYMTWGLSGGIRDLERQVLRTQLDNDTLYHEILPSIWPYTVAIVQEQHNLSISEYPNAPGGWPGMEPQPNDVQEEDFEDLLALPELEPLLTTLSGVISIFGDRDRGRPLP